MTNQASVDYTPHTVLSHGPKQPLQIQAEKGQIDFLFNLNLFFKKT